MLDEVSQVYELKVCHIMTFSCAIIIVMPFANYHTQYHKLEYCVTISIAEDFAGKTEEEIEMMKLMGFGGFDTTKVTFNHSLLSSVLQ